MNKKIVHSVFESIAEKFSDKIAVEEEHRNITYNRLNQQANQIAHILLNKGLKRQDVVGIFLPAGCDYIASIIGVSKAGGIFLPLDMEFPQKRLSHILSKTIPTIFITNQSLKQDAVIKIKTSDVSFSDQQIVAIEDTLDSSDQNPPLIPEPDDGNYIIFTSGSTGEPKAILGCHKSLSHFIHWEMGEFQLDDSVRISQFAPTTFDVSFRDMFVPLLSGGTVCIPTKETGSNIKHLLQWMENSKLTMVHCVPSLFRLLMKEIESSENPRNTLPTLKRFLLAGEPLYGSDVIRWKELMGDRIELVNVYGPSETTLAKAFHRIKETPAEKNMIMPVGQPISNTALLILKDNTLCRIGEIGEIHIKTPFRSKGYFNDSEATQKSFIQNPLTSDSTDIIYKTGDMGKYLPDRSVAFIGRLDRQVKVSGIRIELDEIESVLRNYDAIEQSVVMAYKTPEYEYRLVCYYTEKYPVEIAQIRAWLGNYLPTYMIPSFFVKLNQFKLNIHGKVDRKALPKPEALMYEKIRYEAPANESESKIAAIWKEVLSLDSVGVNNPFFEIGGNSLSAIRILSRIYKTFGTEISIKDFFEHATVRKLSEHLRKYQTSAFEEIPALPPKASYDLSQAQRRLWILNQMEGGGVAYNIPSAYRISGKLDVSALQTSFEQLIQRHESLRTCFIVEKEEPKQQILSNLPFRMEIIDLSRESSPEAMFKIYADKDIATPFDLSQAPLLRVKLFKLLEDQHILLLNIHHIISDAWSLDVLAKEVLSFYDAPSEKKEPLRIQYKDYAAWQNKLLASDAMKAHQTYWHEKLSGEIPVLDLPTDFPRPPVQTFNGSLIRFNFNESVSSQIAEFSKTQDVSLFMSLLSVLKILLHRYSEQKDIIIGSPIAGRNHPDLEYQIGFYVNMLPMRDEVLGTDSFADILEKVKKTASEAHQHQIYPFDRLVDELNLARDVSHSPIFDVGMTFHSDEKIEQKLAGKLDFSELKPELKTGKYDLIFIFVQSGTQLYVNVNYNTDLFAKSTVLRMGTHLEELMTSILQSPDLPIRELNILSDSEKHQILSGFNDTKAEYPKDKNIIDLFEQWVKKTPDRIAVICEDRQLSYRELDELSDIAARYLSVFIQPEDIIGVTMDRSEKLIVSLLGILKAGGAYLPIDPGYPKERIDYILQDSRCGYVITESEYEKMRIEEMRNEKYSSLLTSHFPLPTSLAYVIYTSGSTGKPKGAMIEHQGPINMSLDQIRSFGITSDDHILQFSSQSFDASLYEIFMAFFSGATLVISPRNITRDTQSFVKYLNENAVTVVTLPPVYLSALNRDELKTVKTIITAGEPAVVGDALYYSRHKQYINAYGPTEASVCVSFHRVDPNREYRNGIPIGKAISNTQMLILDESLQLVPIGIPGEICVSGDGLGRGYLNRPDLSKEKFIPNPFAPENRLYKTGDIGKWLPDGNIEFIGRKDDQVKIRGYRIELGEIESALKRHTGIAETLVIAKRGIGSEKELAAYFTAQSNIGDWSAQNLRTFLAAQLPEYMIPAHFVRLEKFPVTPNGKIDRKALPKPETAGLDAGIAYISPTGESEIILAEIWESVLGKKVGIYDNYFALGGDSIKAIQIVSRLRQKNLNLEVIDIFRYPTIAQLAEKITALTRIIDQSPVSGNVPLTAIQAWFFKTFKGEYRYFNQAVILSSREQLNENALRAALQAIQTHHDALRMRYCISENQIIQENILPDNYPFEFEVVNLCRGNPPVVAREELGSYASEVHQRMDLANGSLMKAVLFRGAEVQRDRGTEAQRDKGVLVILHHLVVDMVSWRILIEDIESAYRQALSGQPIKLPEKTDSFKYWAEKINSYADSEKLREEINYWLAAQSDSCPKLPCDSEASDNLFKNSRMVSRRLSRQETQELLGDIHQAYGTTINDILLTALARTLKLWHGLNRTRIMLEGHGRESLFDDVNISRTVGWFTSIYPITLTLADTSDIGAQIGHVRQLLKNIPSNGIGYAVLKYIRNALPDVAAPQISFNYLGQFDEAAETGIFRISDESTGDSVSPMTERFHDIDIRGMIIHGQMELSLTFNTGQYKARTMETLLDNYVVQLKEIIRHCIYKSSGDIAPSELTYQGLSSDDLDKIFC